MLVCRDVMCGLYIVCCACVEGDILVPRWLTFRVGCRGPAATRVRVPVRVKISHMFTTTWVYATLSHHEMCIV